MLIRNKLINTLSKNITILSKPTFFITSIQHRQRLFSSQQKKSAEIRATPLQIKAPKPSLEIKTFHNPNQDILIDGESAWSLFKMIWKSIQSAGGPSSFPHTIRILGIKESWSQFSSITSIMDN